MTDEIIRSIRPEWTLVMECMLRVELHVGRWRARTKADFNEFGLDKGAFKAYTAGARSLLPDELQKELDLLERMARDLLEDYSHKTMFGYLMPQSHYEEFKAWIEDKPLAQLRRYMHNTERMIKPSWEDQSLKARWMELCERIADNRDKIVDEVVETYRPSAIVRWKLEQGVTLDTDVQMDDAWMDETLTEMVKRIPTAEQIRESFSILIVPSFVEAPEDAIKGVKLEEIEAKQAQLNQRLEDISAAHVSAEKRAAAITVRAAQDVARTERNTAYEQQQLEIQAEQERLDREKRITLEVLEHEKRLRAERITKQLDEVAGQLHQLVYTVTTDALASLNKNSEQSEGKFAGRLHPKTIARLKKVAERVQRLNFTDNEELTRVCGELEQLTEDGANTKANEQTVRSALRDVAISVKADLVAAKVETRSARSLDIPDQPSIELVRQARKLDRKPLDVAVEQAQPEPAQLNRQSRKLEVAPAA